MLESVSIANFRCFRAVETPLRPLTVLVGANDTGKSAFLAALRGLGGGFPIEVADHWRMDTSLEPTLVGRQKAGEVRFSGRMGYQVANPQADCRPVALFQMPSEGVSMISSGYQDEGEPPALSPRGENVPALVDYFLRRSQKRFFAYVETLRRLVQGLEEVEVATPRPETRRIDLVIEKGLRINADRASTGVRLLIFFAALAHHPNPPKLILLEEPENGIHPKRLADIIGFLRSLTEGKLNGNPAQVVLTTHSPYLLDLIDLEKDQVLVFRRCDDGSRTAEPASRERLKHFLGEFLLGEVWYNEGEAGLVAGKAP